MKNIYNPTIFNVLALCSILFAIFRFLSIKGETLGITEIATFFLMLLSFLLLIIDFIIQQNIKNKFYLFLIELFILCFFYCLVIFL